MNKVALITGASRGIGKAICAHLALEGFSIGVTARSVTEGDMTPYPGTIHETAALVESLGGHALPIRCDVGVPNDIQGAVEKTLAAFGRIDVMINNARYEGPANWEKIEDLEWSSISTAIDCNFKAPLMFMRLLIPQMAKQGGGLFINVTTGIEGHLSNQNMPGQASTSLLYPSTKAGLNWTTMLLAKEVREHNISVVGLQPGATLVERVTVSKEASMGYNLPRRHSVHMPCVVVSHLATSSDAMPHNGTIIEAHDFALEHSLMTEDEIGHPFKEGEIYDAYAEPYWLALRQARAARG